MLKNTYTELSFIKQYCLYQVPTVKYICKRKHTLLIRTDEGVSGDAVFIEKESCVKFTQNLTCLSTINIKNCTTCLFKQKKLLLVSALDSPTQMKYNLRNELHS